MGKLTSVDQTDGARLTFDTGRVLHIRPSGNAPELRCYVEAEGEAEATGILEEALVNLARAVG